jgi:hypothetical protein
MTTHVKAIRSKILKNLNNVHLLQTIIDFFGYIVMDPEYIIEKEKNGNINNCLDAMKTIDDEFQNALYQIASHKTEYTCSYKYDKVVDRDNYDIVSCMTSDDEEGMYMYRRIIPVITINNIKNKGLALKYPCKPVLVHLYNPTNNKVLIQVTEHSAFLLAKKEENVLFSYDNNIKYTAKDYINKNNFIRGFDQYVNDVVESNSPEEYKLIYEEFTFHELRFAHMYTERSNLYNVHLQDRKTWDNKEKQEQSIDTISDVLTCKSSPEDTLDKRYELFVDDIKRAIILIDPEVEEYRNRIINRHIRTLADMYNAGRKQEAIDWLTEDEYKYLQKYVDDKPYIYKAAKDLITGKQQSKEELDHAKRTWSIICCPINITNLTIPNICCNCGPISGLNTLHKFTNITLSPVETIKSGLRIARVCLILNSCLSAYRFWESDGIEKFKAAGNAIVTAGVNEFAYHSELFRIIQIIRFAHSILPTPMQYKEQVNRQVNDAFTYMTKASKQYLSVFLAHICTYWYRTVTEEWGFFPNYEPVNSTQLALASATADDFFTQRTNNTHSYALIENGWFLETDKIIGQSEAVVRNMLFMEPSNQSYSTNNTYIKSIFSFMETISPMVQAQGYIASVENHLTGLNIGYEMYMNWEFFTSLISLSFLLMYAPTAGNIAMLAAPSASSTLVQFKAGREVGYYVYTKGRHVLNLIGIETTPLVIGRAMIEYIRLCEFDPTLYRSIRHEFENRRGAFENRRSGFENRRGAFENRRSGSLLENALSLKDKM